MNSNYPRGICTEMCPEEEIKQRKREKLLHILEMCPHQKNCSSNNNCSIVKEYSRSAAGRTTQNVKNLRTVDALLRTVDYLLHEVITKDHVQWHIIYEFIADRMRAVRQDMIIQNLPHLVCINLLQPMVKFYVYSAYRLSEAEISIFDPVLNNNHLQESLKRLLSIYDEVDIMKLQIDGDNSNENVLHSRAVIESLYIIHNLGNSVALQRALDVSTVLRSDLIKKCLKISLDFWRGNYIRVCRNLQNLPPLLTTCAVLHLPLIRKKALAAMSAAYSCKNLTFPAAVLQKLLLYDNVKDVLNDCKYYGISTIDDNILFNKSAFLVQKPVSSRIRSLFVDEILREYSVPSLLLENTT